MESATILAIIILVIAIVILIFYYLQATNNPVYANLQAQATSFSTRVGQEEYISNISDKMNDVSGKFKDRIQDEDEEDRVSRTDMISKKISQFIDEQSEQVIEDWDLATNKDIDSVIEKYTQIESDLNDYKESNDERVSSLEDRVNKLDEEIEKLKE